jgi:hypothetical protein
MRAAKAFSRERPAGVVVGFLFTKRLRLIVIGVALPGSVVVVVVVPVLNVAVPGVLVALVLTAVTDTL